MPQSLVNMTTGLKGAHFPASKEELIERARNNSAGQDVLEALHSLPQDAEFNSLADVLKVSREADCVPQTGIIDKRP
jgi:hypothetical protein